jgi:hypothetical protein
MEAQVDDIVLAKVYASGPDFTRADVPEASNIETVRFETGKTPLAPGQAVPVRLTAVENGSAQGNIKRGRYRKHYFPGDTIDITVEDPIKKGICKASTAEIPNIDRLYLIGVRPDSYVRARIDLVRDGSAFARPISVHSMGIQPGDVLTAQTEAESKLATLSRNGFKVELNTLAIVSADVRVEIQEINKTIQATISDPMYLPVAGNRVEAETKPDTSTAVAKPGGYDIDIDEYTHSKHGVTVEIEEADPSSRSIEGKVVDKSKLPSVGDRIQATTEKDSFVAIAEEGYSIQIDRFAHCETDIIIELTEVGKMMKGTVEDFGTLPKEGESIEIKVSQGNTWALSTEYGYGVSLLSPSLVTDTATGEIVSLNGDSEPTVRVDSYETELPSVGDEFVGIAHTRSDTVETEDRPYDIYIPNGVDSYGQATGKITSVNQRIEGEIDEIQYDRDMSTEGEANPVGSMNSVIHNTSL